AIFAARPRLRRLIPPPPSSPLFPYTTLFRSLRAEAERGGVRNGYERPEALGPDRWAALIAARALHNGASLVVNAGTATTVDMLRSEEHTSELHSPCNLVCRLLLEKKKKTSTR